MGIIKRSVAARIVAGVGVGLGEMDKQNKEGF